MSKEFLLSMPVEAIPGYMEAELSALQEQSEVSGRSQFPDVDDVLEKAARIVAIIKALFDDLPKAKFNFMYVLTHFGRFAQAVLALFAVFMEELTNKALGQVLSEVTASRDGLMVRLTDLKAQEAPDEIVKYLQKVIEVANLLIAFINSTNWKAKLDFFFFLLNGGKIADLIKNIISVFKPA